MTAADTSEMPAVPAGERSPRSGRRRAVTVVVVLAVLGAAGGGVAWWALAAASARADRIAAEELTVEVAGAFEQRDLADLPASVPDLAERFTTVTEALSAATLDVAAGEVTVDDVGARADLAVTWTFPGGADWRYTTQLDLTRTGSDDPRWQVEWTPALVHPQLSADERLSASRVQPARGDVLDPDGEPIVTLRPVVAVSVDPTQVDDGDAVALALGELLGVDGEALAGRIAEASSSGAAVPVITLREDAYAAVEAAVSTLPGVVAQPSEQPLAPTREFARQFLGTVGEVTAEQLETEPGRYVAGDQVGRSGLQRALDGRLGGSPGLTVSAVTGGAAEDEGGDGDAEGRPLFEVAPEDGQDVTITLRVDAQLAADAALAGIETPSALVAIDVGSGDVVAVANGPETGFDTATAGQYPPGSTFKVVTSTLLLADGLAAADVVGCPGTATVDGRAFGNAEDFELGDVPFATVFAQSCNTAFVELSQGFEPGDLQATAQQYYGIGQRGDLGVGAFAGEVPDALGPTGLAAGAIGQGEVLVSPLVNADVAATVARGSWLEPRLLLDPAPQGERATGEPLPGADTLQELTRAVVTDGSGTAMLSVPGAPVHGKTGTAEFGGEDEERTHAWFIGYQETLPGYEDGLAFAVVVAETTEGFGGEVAAPVAAEFLATLADPAAPAGPAAP